MRLLLDTSALIYLLSGDERLGRRAREAITDPANTVYLSDLTPFELAVMIRIGKLAMDLPAALARIEDSAIQRLAVEDRHCIAMSRLVSVGDHRDPFDLMLIAQALTEGLMIVTSDRKFEAYPVSILS